MYPQKCFEQRCDPPDGPQELPGCPSEADPENGAEHLFLDLAAGRARRNQQRTTGRTAYITRRSARAISNTSPGFWFGLSALLRHKPKYGLCYFFVDFGVIMLLSSI